LAAIIQSKTAGNPFYMREMLDTCHRKQCIWYDYKDNGWRYDLDRVFKQFEAKSYHDTPNSEFVTGRLQELPPSSRAILGWASLIGNSFSFELIQKLLSGEFDYDESGNTPGATGHCPLSHPQEDAVIGLQAAIQAYIIVSTQDDDRFRFVHDRYVQAARSLCEVNGPKMHFIIAQTLRKYYSADERLREITATHICASVDVINKRVVHRQSLRKVLFDCAQAAAESGARPTASRFYTHCFALLQKIHGMIAQWMSITRRLSNCTLEQPSAVSIWANIEKLSDCFNRSSRMPKRLSTKLLPGFYSPEYSQKRVIRLQPSRH
jgi:predicted ATPase